MTAAALARVHRAAAAHARRQACATCGRAVAPFTCAWRCEVPRNEYPERVKPGDTLITPQSKRQCPVTFVNVIRGAGAGQVLLVEITIEYRHGRRKPPYPQFTYERKPWGNVYVLRPGVCGARCCERHAREVGEGVAYCRAHWRAWEDAAGDSR